MKPDELKDEYLGEYIAKNLEEIISSVRGTNKKIRSDGKVCYIQYDGLEDIATFKLINVSVKIMRPRMCYLSAGDICIWDLCNMDNEIRIRVGTVCNWLAEIRNNMSKNAIPENCLTISHQAYTEYATKALNEVFKACKEYKDHAKSTYNLFMDYNGRDGSIEIKYTGDYRLSIDSVKAIADYDSYSIILYDEKNGKNWVSLSTETVIGWLSELSENGRYMRPI